MVWRWPGDKPLSELMMVLSTDAYMRHINELIKVFAYLLLSL